MRYRVVIIAAQRVDIHQHLCRQFINVSYVFYVDQGALRPLGSSTNTLAMTLSSPLARLLNLYGPIERFPAAVVGATRAGIAVQAARHSS